MAVVVSIVAGATRHQPDDWCEKCWRQTIFEYHLYGYHDHNPTNAIRIGTWRGCGICDVDEP